MMNEYIYCPRLFYFEFVEGVFIHNADTLEGKSAHQRVDQKKSGSLPDSAQSTVEAPPNELIHSRSISLFSENLGITAKLDLAEIRHTNSQVSVIPVEYKKGKPKEGEEGPEIWDTDQMQLGLQMLLLEENGYACPEGVLYYRETRQRVSFYLTDEKRLWIQESIQSARKTCNGPLPPPLDHSQKCARCSLLPVCMPDESHALSKDSYTHTPSPNPQLEWDFANTIRQDTLSNWVNHLSHTPLPSLPSVNEVRRLIAPNPDTRSLYLNTPGQYVSKSGDILVVKEEGEKVAEFRTADLNHVCVWGPVQISTPVVHTLCERGIPITWFSSGGWFYGITRGHEQTNVFNRIEQFRVAADPQLALFLARQFVCGKIRNHRTLLMRNHLSPDRIVLKQLKALAHASLQVTSIDSLFGVEGSAAMLFFSQFQGMLKPGNHESPASDPSSEPPSADKQDNSTHFQFTFDQRNRRPPKDPVNALLSLMYSLLAKDCTLACHIVGLDPYVGFLHQPRFGRPALGLDLMEEFRPLVAESVVLNLINTRVITPKDFIRAGEGVNLTPQSRKRAFLAYERRMNEAVTHPVFQYRVGYRRAIELQARLLAKFLIGETESYYPFVTR